MEQNQRPLWKHQEEAIRMAGIEPDLALIMDPGVGKSRAMVETLRRKYAASGRIRRTLIMAPVVVCENWRNEFAMYSKVNQKDIVVLTKSGKARVKDFIEAVGESLNGNKIVITNYQSMLMEEFRALLYKWSPEILICDESQRLKNPKSKMAIGAATIADRTYHNYILTGTPILQSAMDLFMQFRILDRGATFGKNFFAFRAQYFYDKNSFMDKQKHFPKWEPRPETNDVLQDKIRSKSVRAVKSECLDLPPFVRQELFTGMGAEQTKAYKQMKQEYLAWVEDNKGLPRAVVAQLAVTKALRLQEIVSGYAKDETGQVHRFKDIPRLDALSELLEDLTEGHKVIVWAWFKENHAMISEVCTNLGVEHVHLNGEMSVKQKEESMDMFRTNPNVKVMIANQGAASVGINLVEASYSVYYSKNFALEHDEQSEARNYRGGSEVHTSVTRIDLIAKGTIDELVTESLRNKKSIGEHILSWRENI